jgi:hypothetical protein
VGGSRRRRGDRLGNDQRGLPPLQSSDSISRRGRWGGGCRGGAATDAPGPPTGATSCTGEGITKAIVLDSSTVPSSSRRDSAEKRLLASESPRMLEENGGGSVPPVEVTTDFET